MKIRLSIKTKIFLVILAPSLLLFFVIYLDYRNLNALGRSAELILSKNYKSIQKSQQVRQILEATQNRILSTIFLNPTQSPAIPPSIRQVTELFIDCRDNVTEAGEEKIIDTLFMDYKRYESALSDMMTAKRVDGPDVVSEILEEAKNYDLIVMGCSRKPSIYQIAQESIPEKIARMSSKQFVMVNEARGVKSWVKRWI